MTYKLIPYFLPIFILLVAGCSRPAAIDQSHIAEVYIPDSGSVGFDIDAVKLESGSIRLEGTYASHGKVAKFAVEFGPTRKMGNKKSNDFPMWTGEGRFLAEPGSDATILLADLRKALEAKATLSRVQRAKTLPFTFVDFGDRFSQAPGGGFNENPPGGWTARKIFIGEGEQEGEVFVNFNLAIGKGQFSIKDADYGDIVLKQLATIL